MVAAHGAECRLLDGEPGSNADLAETLAAAKGCSATVLVLDSYGIGDPYAVSCSEAGFAVAVMDDHGAPPEAANLVIDPSGPCHGADDDDRILRGPQHVILRPEFERSFRLRTAAPVERVFVSMGGADPLGLTDQLIRLLDDAAGGFHVEVVVGPFFQQVDRLKERAAQAARSVRVLENPDSLDRLMERADMACAGAGQTLYELAAAGCPTVGVGFVDNQRRNLATLDGAIVPVWLAAGTSVAPVGDAVGLLLADGKRRSEFSRRAMALVDGRGAARVADRLEALARSTMDAVR